MEYLTGIFDWNILLEYFSGILLSNISYRIFEHLGNLQVLHLSKSLWRCADTGTKWSFMPAMPALSPPYVISYMPYMPVLSPRRPSSSLKLFLCVVNILHLSRKEDHYYSVIPNTIPLTHWYFARS